MTPDGQVRKVKFKKIKQARQSNETSSLEGRSKLHKTRHKTKNRNFKRQANE